MHVKLTEVFKLKFMAANQKEIFFTKNCRMKKHNETHNKIERVFNMKNFMLRQILRICCRWKNRFRWNYFVIKTLSQVIVCNIKWWNFLLIKQPRSVSKSIYGCGRKEKLIDCTLKTLLTLTSWIFHLKISRKIYALNLRWVKKIHT